MELLPTVYEVKFHFLKNQLPKLPNGKYDGMTLIKSISEGCDDMTTVVLVLHLIFLTAGWRHSGVLHLIVTVKQRP